MVRAAIALLLAGCLAGASLAQNAPVPDEAQPPPQDHAAADDLPSTDAQSGGFGGKDDKPTIDLKPRAHTVAIVSAFGDTIGYQALNVALIENGYSENVHLDGAKLDDAVVAAAMHALTTDVPGFGAIPVDVPSATLVAHANSVRLSDGPLDMVRDDLKAWRASHPVDLVILLLPGMGQISKHDYFKRAFFGLGVSGRQTILFMRAVVLDGKTGEILNDLKARAVGRLAGTYNEAAFSNPTPQSNALLAAEMRALLSNTVPGLLRGVGL